MRENTNLEVKTDEKTISKELELLIERNLQENRSTFNLYFQRTMECFNAYPSCQGSGFTKL